ncbi:hypothetical protein ITP53_11660 [Nonomuraea sp. K274]|uniref:Uncharacterized protein n=1 Tax=Nonomuraea cypriaca TaxID=1187855 RepID=A0A931A7E4_9ACTN|nr:hypothetical protein [Nonomuraea cypriaca]MBF8186390.1 hypothetical protein [Nonomuraea cypriaca]
MRSRLPAALVFLLSWFLPATILPATSPHTAAATQSAVVRMAAAWAHDPQGVRQEPPRDTTMRAGNGLLGLAAPAGPAVLPSGHRQPRPTWAVVAAPVAADAPADRRPTTAPARGPPSTGF